MRGTHKFIVALMVSGLASGCSTLPPQPVVTPSQSIVASVNSATDLSRRIDPRIERIDLIYPLIDPLEAFSTRVQLIQRAQRSLDLAYYIWGNDLTGKLMFEELQQAAKRGVRVRLLLDDNNTKGLDALLIALNDTPNFEIRLFNPMGLRHLRPLNYVLDFNRTQRRMHGKSFNADGEVMIIGGRNISDPYYRVTSDFFFADLDVMAAGSMLPAMNQSFDRYWNHALAYPVDSVAHASVQQQHDALQDMQAALNDPRADTYIEAVERNRTLDQWLLGQNLATTSNAEANTIQTSAILVDDHPIKIAQATPFDQTIGARIRAISGQAQQSLDVISPYFVPEDDGTQALIEMAKRGIKIRILTNSLAATDVPALHGFYARRRVSLLQAGIQLYEFKPTANSRPISRWRLREWRGRQSNGSLHAKAISWDDDMTYVGSMNLDPRSLMLNSEVGLMITGPVAAQQINEVFNDRVLEMAYHVTLDPQSKLQWTEKNTDDQIVTHHSEPAASFKRKATAKLVGLLPIGYLM